MQSVFGLAVSEELVAGASAIALATLVGVLAALALRYRRRWLAAEPRVPRPAQRALPAAVPLARAPPRRPPFLSAHHQTYLPAPPP